MPDRRLFPRRILLLRACLHGGGGPQVGEVTRLAVVEKWPTFTCKLTTRGSRGDVTGCCCVVTRYVNRKWRANDAFLRAVFFSSHYLLLLQHFSAVAFYCHFWRACKCNMNLTPARWVTPPWVIYMTKWDPGWHGYLTWQTGQPA